MSDDQKGTPVRAGTPPISVDTSLPPAEFLRQIAAAREQLAAERAAEESATAAATDAPAAQSPASPSAEESAKAPSTLPAPASPAKAQGKSSAASASTPAARKDKPDAQGITHTFVVECARAFDKGNGLLFAAMMRGHYVFVPEQKQWLAWQSTAWSEVFDYAVCSAVERVADRYMQAVNVEQKIYRDEMEAAERDEYGQKKESRAAKAAKRNSAALTKAVDILHKKAGVLSCLDFALYNDEPLAVSADDLNTDPYLVACASGVVDLRTGALRGGAPEDHITRVVPTEWLGLDTPCPLWEKMLFTILGERQDVFEYFHKILGMALCGKITEKIFIVMLGEDGNSGKTTIFEIILRILKGYVSPMQVEMLLDQKNPRDPNSPTPSIMAMRGQRLCWASEPGENRRFSVEQVKLFSGNDSLVGRYPWDKSNTAFEPSHTLFLLTNHKMRAASNDTPFWERLRLVNCPFSFVDNPKGDAQRKINRDLKDDIVKHESAGVFAWFVRGYQKYVLEGLATPESVQRDTEAYRREEDLILTFMEACIEADEGNRVSSADMYGCFKAWFIDNLGKNSPSSTTFGKLAPRHMRKDKIGGKVWYYDVSFNDDARGKYVSGL